MILGVQLAFTACVLICHLPTANSILDRCDGTLATLVTTLNSSIAPFSLPPNALTHHYSGDPETFENGTCVNCDEDDEDDDDDDDDDDDEEVDVDEILDTRARQRLVKFRHDSRSNMANSKLFRNEQENGNETLPPEDPWTLREGLDSKTGLIAEISDYFECPDVFSEDRLIPSESIWGLLRGTYQAVVGPMASTVTNMYGDGFQVAYRVELVPNKGRAIFAGQDIAEGTRIWNGDYKASFFHGVEFRRYLASLPQNLVCDVIVWSYIELKIVEDQRALSISVDLDPFSLVERVMGEPEGNVNIGGNYRALRDIEVGEELVVNFDMELDKLWSKFGLV